MAALAVGAGAAAIWAARGRGKACAGKRMDYVSSYAFPEVARRVLERERPDLSADLRSRAWEGLREYFLLHAHKPGRFLGMPSETVDAAWHAFLLCEREYAAFCKEAFGKRLEHVPDPGCLPKRLDGAFSPKKDVVATWEAQKLLRSERPDLLLPAGSALFALDAAAGSGWIHTPESLRALERAAKKGADGGGSGSSCGSSGSSCSSGSSGAGDCSSSGSGDCGSSCGSSCGGGCGGGCGG